MPASPSPRWWPTPDRWSEREVLYVLITGVTNRAIAERRCISEKTVSVHVRNLLAKLGCASRGKAAALARKLAAAG